MNEVNYEVEKVESSVKHLQAYAEMLQAKAEKKTEGTEEEK